jgi:hypothetical protein
VPELQSDKHPPTEETSQALKSLSRQSEMGIEVLFYRQIVVGKCNGYSSKVYRWNQLRRQSNFSIVNGSPSQIGFSSLILSWTPIVSVPAGIVNMSFKESGAGATKYEVYRVYVLPVAFTAVKRKERQ